MLNDLLGVEAVLGLAAAAVAAVPHVCDEHLEPRAPRVLAMRLLAGRGMDDGHNEVGPASEMLRVVTPLRFLLRHGASRRGAPSG